MLCEVPLNFALINIIIVIEKNELYVIKKRKQRDIKFKLICNIRRRTNKAFKSQNIMKTNKTNDLVGCSPKFFKKWILHQLYGKMTEEIHGYVWTIDH